MSSKKLPWKPEFGVQFGKTESDTGGNFETFYPLLKAEKLIFPKMRLLSIGGGYGAMEVHIAKELGAKLGFVEPSPNLMKAFERRVEAAGIASQITERIEAPFQKANLKFRYDLILSIHSWYYIGCDEMQLRKALSHLEPKGVLYIALSSSSCPIVKTIGRVSPKSEPTFHLEDLAAYARSKNIRFETKEYQSDVELSRYVSDGELTEYGRHWLAYFARTEWTKIPEAVRLEARDSLVQSSVGGIIRDRFGALIFKP
jgi:hypothetical protein